MAVNTLGQTLQLLPVAAPGNDLTLGLQPGDILQGRLVDILPDNRAIIQIKGFNLLAQLPEAQNGQQFSKGQILDLAVLQAQPNSNSSNSSGTSASAQAATPALTLKLTGISSSIVSGSQASALNQEAIESPGMNLAPSNLEALLVQANLPITSANMQAAQSLSHYGLPVDAASINELIQTANNLTNVDNPLQSLAVPAMASKLPQPVQEAINEARTLLNVLGSQGNSGVDRPAVQQLLQQLNNLESQPSGTLESGASLTPQQMVQALNQSLDQVSDGAPQALQNFSQLLENIKSSIPSLQAENPDSTASSAQPGNAAEPTVTLQREVAAVVMRSLTPALENGTVSQSDIMAALSQLSGQVAENPSSQAEQIIASASAQASDASATASGQEALSNLQASIASVQQAFTEEPLSTPVRSLTGLSSEFASRNLPSPKTALSSLPQESVIEAVAFLKARQVPPSRPAVEAVASQLSGGSDLGSQMNSILTSGQSLPQGILQGQPQLQEALGNLNSFLNQNGIQPEASGVADQIRNFVMNSGLNLEPSLASPPTPASSGKLSAPAPLASHDPAESLKANLLKLQDAVMEASKHPAAQASPELSAQLDELSAHLNSAVNAMHTLQLAARPTPAFDVTTVQLPVYFDGPMGSGQLSVYWKKGRPHEINGQDPVNVVFLLNTRGLGDVKVQLQVWKGECRCQVSVGNEETRKFIQAETPALEKSFEQNTPFKLSSIAVSGNAGSLKPPLDFVETAAGRSGAGLNLTA